MKTLRSNEFLISIQEKEWSQLAHLGTSSELIVIKYQNDTVEEVIQISELWQTLNEAESVLRERQSKVNISHKVDEKDDYLIVFSSALGESNNNLILNWHNFLECVAEGKLKRYYPLGNQQFVTE